MTDDFIQEVRDIMLPALAPVQLRIDDFRETPAAFGNALVDLSGGSLRVRVIRERGQIFAAFGSAVEPTVWFDSAIVMDFLELTETGGFHDSDSKRTLLGIASFVRVHFKELRTLFSPPQYVVTKQKLSALQKDRADRQWGSKK